MARARYLRAVTDGKDAPHARRPRFSAEAAGRLAAERFGVRGAAEELASERDQNFRLHVEGGLGFVLKIARAGEDEGALELQGLALERVGRALPGLVPEVVPALGGERWCTVDGDEGHEHRARLLTWIPGAPLAHVRPHSPPLLRDMGRALGRVDRALEGLEHPAAERELEWDLTRASDVIASCARTIDDPRRRGRALRFAEGLDRDRLRALRRGLIHNDANDHNVLVRDELAGQKVCGLLDFGDMLRTVVLGEVAIAATYAMLGKRDPLAAGAQVVAGYNEAFPLEEPELALLYELIRARLYTSVALAARNRRTEPDDAYLAVSEAPAWELLERLEATHPELAQAVFRAACGLEPAPRSAAVVGWLREHARDLSPVFDGLSAETLRPVDLSVASALAGTRWPEFPETRHVLVGRYDEARVCYEGEAYAEAGEDAEERRTVHLGLDLFVPPGTEVRAPLDAVVHGVADNARPFDYGPTVILRHEPAEGIAFYSLYGHLGRESLAGLASGARVAKGEAFARIGTREENGCWPPHLHLQLVVDVLGNEGDFPGVAAPSRRRVWTSLSPDPHLLLGLAGDRPRPLAPEEILGARRERIGPSLGLSYRRPLTIERGSAQFLFDHEGRAYLDAVNNVAHVGHCNPRVVAAGQQQMAVLNTNTRYLHENLVLLARRLADTLPHPLEVCFFVCSGSEANELALRMARAHTGARDVVVVAGGYHGNTATLIELSSYKFAGPGGFAPPAHVHEVPLPDPYRGPYRRDDPECGARYAAHVRDAVAGIRPAAFLVEPLPGCGGQIVPPRGWLKAAFEHVRAAGGVCIADEVQTGFGRVGSHFWAFQAQNVVPDVVTLGKPMGNGHPLGAVVTTRAIAESFANGMEYFNTFGGNPVSCAIGLAVLEEIEAHGLQARAERTGSLLRSGLRSLMERFPLIGDVRGSGLFLGVELVLDRESLAPAPEHAAHVVERMKDKGVLLSTDGPLRNVLKIKPPLVFDQADARRLCAALEEVLAETCLRVG